jgi:hypothetical protein
MIAVLAPYARCETTAAALRLADAAQAAGLGVRYTALGRHARGVDLFWDGRVQSGRDDGVYKAAYRCDAVVHFACNAALLKQTRLVAEKAPHILVPGWHAVTPADWETVRQYDLVVCPSKAFCDSLRRVVYGNEKTDKVTWAVWDAGVPPVRREGTVADARVRACFYCDASVIDFCGPMALHCVNHLLGAVPKLDVTLLSTKSWCQSDRRELRRLRQVWPEKRLALRAAGDFRSVARHFHAHDWVVQMGVRSDFAIVTSLALSCGAVVMANDVEPHSEVLSHFHNGVLVSCEVRRTPAGAPVAVPLSGVWLEACHRLFAGNQQLFAMQAKDWRLRDLAKSFDSAWVKLLS